MEGQINIRDASFKDITVDGTDIIPSYPTLTNLVPSLGSIVLVPNGPGGILYIGDGVNWQPAGSGAGTINQLDAGLGITLTPNPIVGPTGTIALTSNVINFGTTSTVAPSGTPVALGGTVSFHVIAGSIGPTELTPTGVVAGQYGPGPGYPNGDVPYFQVDADGRLDVAGTTAFAGDISGPVSNVTVVGLQTHPVSNAVPAVGNVLTFNGAQWFPSPGGGAGGVTSIASNGGPTEIGAINLINGTNVSIVDAPAGTFTFNVPTGAGGVITFSAGATGLTPVAPTAGAVTLGGTLIALNGGTGQSSYTVGDLLYADTTTTLAKLPDVAVSNALISGGISTAPSWGKISNATLVNSSLTVTAGTGLSGGGLVSLGGSVTLNNTGVLSVNANGGAAETGDLTLVNGTNVSIVDSPAGTFTFNVPTGAGGVITFSAGTTGLTPIAPTAGAVTLGGTLIALNGGTGFSGYAVGDLLYADTTTTLAKLSDIAVSNALISGGIGAAPSWGKISNATLVNSSLTVTAGTGLSGGGLVSLGGSVTLDNAGVLSIASNGGTAESGAINLINGSNISIVDFPAGTFTINVPTGAGGVTTFSAGTTGFTPVASTAGAVTLGGTLIAANGGTGQISYAVGDLLYADTTTTLAKLPDVAVSNALISGGIGVAPSWGKISNATLSNSSLTVTAGTGLSGGGLVSLGGTVTLNNAGVLSIASNGGAAETGAISLVNGTNVSIVDSPAGTFTFNVPTGAGGVTTFSAGTTGLTPNTATAGVVTLGGTLIALNGGTGFSGYTIGDLLYADTTTTLAKLPDIAVDNALISGGIGAAPSWGKISNATLANSSLTVTAGTGLSGGGLVSLGGSVTLNNAGVLSVKANASTAEVGALTLANGTNITIVDSPAGTFTFNVPTGAGGVITFSAGTTGLTPVAPTAGAVTLGGTLIAINGGTGQISYAVGDLLYADTTTTLAKLPDVVVSNALISGGVGVAPSWGKISNATLVNSSLTVTAGTGLSGGGLVSLGGSVTLNNTGVLSIASNGGTAETGAISLVNGTNINIVDSPAGTFTFNVPTGAGGVTTFSAGTTGLTPVASTAGAVTLGGTLIALNGGTGFSGYTVGDLLYADTTTTLAKLPDVAVSNALISGGVGVAPSWGKISNATLANSSLTVTAGTGLSGGGLVSLGGSVTLNNTGVLSVKANGGTAETGAISLVNGTNVSIVDSPAGTFTFNVPTGAGGVTTFSAGTTGLTPNTATAGAVTLGGTLIALNGGTGFSGYTIGDLLYANTTTTLAKLSDIATGNVLISGGTSTAPAWGKVSLTTAVSGILPIANGGTALSTTPANGQLLIGNGTNYTLAAITSGTAISVVNGSGSITVNNTGVTALTGTANQVTVSASTGSVTLSTPAVFIAPGTIQDTTGMLYSTNATVSAAGTTQGTATALTKSYNVVTTVASSTGVALQTPSAAGLRVVVVNKGANPLSVYPALGGTIDAAAANAAVTLPVGATVTYEASSTTQWYTVDPAIVGGTGIAVTYGNGQTTISSSATGVSSFQTSLSGLTPSTATTGAVTLAGTLGSISGGTGATTAPTAGQLLVGVTGGTYIPFTVTSGTGISTTTGSGTFQINNTGVTSLTTNTGLSTNTSATGAVTVTNTGVLSWSAGTTGLTPNTATTGAVTLAGTLVVGNGGTGATTLTSNGVVYGNGTSAVGVTAAGTTGQVLIGTTSSAPSWSALSGLAVTSLTGTTNQVAVSASTGAVTLSTPSTFIAPGTIQDTTGMAYSTNAAISAAGTNQATATQLTVSYNVVTTVASGTGVILPTPSTIGYIINIVNKGANSVNIYPSGTGQIDGLASSLPVILPVNGTVTYQASSLTQWYTINPPIIAGTGASVTYSNGTTIVSATGTGVSTFQTSLSGLTPSTATTGAVTLAGTLGATSGGTGTTSAPTAGQLLVGVTGGTYTPFTVTSGTGISTTTGSGTFQINNTGVTSLTTNTGLSTNVSATGAVTVTNTGVTSLTTNTGLSTNVSATGAVTVTNTGVLSWSAGTTGLTPNTATTGAVTLAGVLTAVNGGTGQSSYAVGDLLYADTTTTLAKISDVATGNVLLSGGVSTAPSWGKVSLTSAVSGILPIANGGTALSTTPANGQLLIGNGTNYTLAAITAGTAISVVNGSGSITVNNAGVTALTGTANQVTVSASTGSVTLSTPSTFIAPGTIQDTTGMLYSTNAAVSAAGATQGTATALTKSYNVVTTVASSTGVALPTPGAAGLRVVIVNKGANPLSVYPASGGTIDGTALNAAVTLPVGATATYEASSTTQWYTVDPAIVGGTGITVTYGNGQTTIASSATGVSSFQTSLSGLTPSTATTGVVTLAGTLGATSGGTGTTTAPTSGQLLVGVTGGTFIPFTVTSGTGISTTTGSGTFQINNTGVTSLTTNTGLSTNVSATGAVTVTNTGVLSWSAGTTGLTPNTATTGAVTLSGVLIAVNGGTGQSSYAIGDLLYADTTTTLAKLSDIATGNVLISGGTSTAPAWGKVSLTTAVSGILPIANGGTALSATPTNGQLLIGNGTNYTLAAITSGTAINVVNGSGSITVNNTGVTALTGTTNQVAVSASTGSVTLSTPAVFIAPGTIQDTTGMLYSTNAAVSAAGTTQGTATALTKSYNVVTTVASATGVALPTPGAAGLRVVVVNKGANALLVYPASGGTIDGAAANAAVTLPVGATVTYEASSTTQWYTVDPAIVGGAGITVTYGNGQTTIAASSATGVSSFQTSLSGLTPSTATTGAVTLAGTLGTTSGGTGTSTAPTAGQLLVGVTGGTFIPFTVTSGTGISTTTGSGTFQINNTGVTSLTTNTGLSTNVSATGAVTVTNTGVLTWSGGTTGLMPNTATTGAVALSGTLVVGNGGTGATTLTSNGVVYGNGTSAVGITAAGTTGQVLIGTTSSAPSWGTLSGLAVTSLTGTANQVTVSASTGAVTLSTPVVFIAPGTIQDTTGMAYSTNAGVSAAGTNQATATQLTVSYNVLTTVASGTGVILPLPNTIGYIINIVNKGANAVNIYPNGTDQIDGLAASLPVILPANGTVTYQASSLTRWYTINPPITAGTGASVTYSNGTTIVSATGGGGGVASITGNTGPALTGAINIVTSNTNVTFAGTGSTETLNFGATSNLNLGNSLASLTSGTNNVGLGLNTLSAATSDIGNTGIGFSALSAINGVTGATAVGSQTLTVSTVQGDAFGYQSLMSNMNGTNNAAFGYQSLMSNTNGNNNAAFGYQSLSANTSGISNAAFGPNALSSNATGTNNTAVGYQSLLSTTGSANTAVGSNSNPAGTGSFNVAVGYQSLLSTTGSSNTAVGCNSNQFGSGSLNVAVGYQSLLSSAGSNGSNNTAVGSNSNQFGTGSLNVAVGSSALQNIATSQNTAIGAQALVGSTTVANNTGSDNTAVGYACMQTNTTGTSNTAVGWGAMQSTTTGSNNVAIGVSSLDSASFTGSSNVAIGLSAMAGATSAVDNVAIGAQALSGVSSGGSNTAVGYQAMVVNTASNNTGLGMRALFATTTGTSITSVGYQSHVANVTGSNNTIVGYLAASTMTAASNVTAVGTQALQTSSVTGDAFGYQALKANTNGTQNVAMGTSALAANTTGAKNTAVGYLALTANISGSNNVAMGDNSGATLTSGSNNTIIGNGANVAAATASAIVLGAAAVATASGAVIIGTTLTNSVANSTEFCANATEQFRMFDAASGNYSYKSVKSTSAAAAVTPTAAQLVGGYFLLTNSGATTFTLPTGASLSAQAQIAGNAYVGLTFRCLVTAGGTATMIMFITGTGITLYGPTLSALQSGELIFVNTGTGTWDVTVK